LGYKSGDRAIIYLADVDRSGRLHAGMCARLGVIHSVVFGGFSSKALHERIIDVGASLVITADEQVRGGKQIPTEACS
jgi:acetyl-CoA synthetase